MILRAEIVGYATDLCDLLATQLSYPRPRRQGEGAALTWLKQIEGRRVPRGCIYCLVEYQGVYSQADAPR